jgi:hypothetical protein
LNESLSLIDQRVKHRSVVVLEPPDDRINSPVREKMSFSFLNSAVAAKIQNPAEPSIFCIHVKHWNGDMFLIKAEPTDYIDDVKDKISVKKKIPVNKQRLIFDGREVADDCNLQSQGIVDGSTLMLGLMEVHVDLPRGKRVTVEVKSEDTVIRMKRLLKNQSGIGVENQFLMFGGQELENTKKLSFYNIDHGDVVMMEGFKVKVADWTGGMFEVEGIQPSINITDLKVHIERIAGIPPSGQVIKMSGQKLNDFLRLKDQGVKHRSVLVLEPPDAHILSPIMKKAYLGSIPED